MNAVHHTMNCNIMELARETAIKSGSVLSGPIREVAVLKRCLF